MVESLPVKGPIERFVRIRIALAELRAASIRIEISFFDRLIRLANPGKEPRTAREHESIEHSMFANVVLRARRFGRWLPLGLTSASMLLTWIRQYRMIRRSRTRGDLSVVAVALASNRLTLRPGNGAARQQLASLARPLTSGADSSAARIIASNRTILLFDPQPISGLWEVRDLCWQDSIWIIDGGFLAIGVFLEAISHPIKVARALANVITETRAAHRQLGVAGASISLGQAITCSLVGDAYGRLLGESTVEAVFFTSNSQLTEYLRAYLLQHPGCTRIYELMHGIGSIPAERFFAALAGLSAPGEFSKHIFVPQLPNLPLYGVLKTGSGSPAPQAVNAYLNQYLDSLRSPADSPSRTAAGKGSNDGLADDLAAALIREWQILVPQEARAASKTMVTLLGNHPTSGRLYDSTSFQAECFLISQVSEIASRRGLDLSIVYAPHPLHARADFVHPFFQKHRVTVCRHSVLTWLGGDLCMSLFSSAMFEASYLGAPAWTPILPEDNFFTEGYLALLAHPASASLGDLQTSLEAFLVQGAAMPKQTIAEKIRARLATAGLGAPVAERAVMVAS